MSTHDAAASAPFSNSRRTVLYQETPEPATEPQPITPAGPGHLTPTPPATEPTEPVASPPAGPAPSDEAPLPAVAATTPAPGVEQAAPGRDLAVATPVPVPGQIPEVMEPVSGAVIEASPDPTPAQWGPRAQIRVLSGGLIRLPPSDAEVAHRRAITTIRQATWLRSVDVLVTNPKGGTAKTPATLILAGILGQLRGGYVVAWEACEANGSLSRRGEGQPARGLAELLAGVADVQSAGNLGGYVAPQTSHADVIGSIASRQVLTAQDVLAVRGVLDTYYRIQITDSGNNLGHEAYEAALQTADAVVLPCLVSIDSLAGVQDALAAVRRGGRAGLGSRVVIVLTHDGGPEDPAIAQALRARLQLLGVAEVLEVPFDAAIRLGGEITLSALSPASIRAWTAVAAALVRCLKTAQTSTDLVRQLQERLRAPASGGARSTRMEEISQ